MKLKKGDRVGLKDDIYMHCSYNPWYSKSNIAGTVDDSKGSWAYVKWDNGDHNNYTPDELFKIDEKIFDVDDLFEGIEL